jgi:hypothetical protein
MSGVRQAGMPFASLRIMAWLNRNSAAAMAAGTMARGDCDQTAKAPRGKSAPTIQASRAIHDRCGWRST